MLLDGDHRPVADAIAWYDPRGTAEAGAFLAGPGASLRLTQDVPPDATFSLFKLLWIGDHQPADLARASSWTDLGDFVLLGLGGDLVMDWSHASRAGAFDPWARAWDRDTIAATGLDVAFPPLVASGTVIGTLAPDVAKRTGLPPGVRIVTGGHDHLCAAFGAGLRTRIRPVPLGRHVGGAPGAAGGSPGRSGWPRPPLPPRPGLLRRP